MYNENNFFVRVPNYLEKSRFECLKGINLSAWRGSIRASTWLSAKKLVKLDLTWNRGYTVKNKKQNFVQN